MRKNVFYLVATVVVALGALVATIVVGNSPVLGLDLQGGVSVRLVPVGDPSSGSLDVAVDIIRNRVDALGVAEAEVTREGDNIVVNLPGVKDRDKAQRIVGRTAELRFRPVLAQLPPERDPADTTTTTGDPATSVPPESTTTTTAPPTEEATRAATQAALDACTSGDTEGATTQLAALPEIATTRVTDDRAKSCVILPLRRESDELQVRLLLGGACVDADCTGGTFTGKDIAGADSDFQQGGYAVTVDFKDSGQDKINAFAGAQFGLPTPQNQMAITLDGVVQSAPAFQTSTFDGDVVISGDFSRTESDDLARLLRYGALPVRFDEDQQTVENVSPTLGKDQLRAGVTAGLIGLALVFIYMFVYYRILALVVVLGLGLTAAATYSLVSFLGNLPQDSQIPGAGLALTLAGVTGLIVSVGVTVDSYIVYFERLKDEVRSGKTVRSSVDRGFVRSFRTILAADLVSLIGAGVLYWLAIGSVRGFAFFLGLATALDLAVTYFFMHPLVVLLARRPGLLRARFVGIASGLDAAEVTT